MELPQIASSEWCRRIPPVAVVLGEYCAIEHVLDDRRRHRCRLDEAHDGPHTYWCNRPYAQRADPVAPRGYLERFRERASRRREAVPSMALRRVA